MTVRPFRRSPAMVLVLVSVAAAAPADAAAAPADAASAEREVRMARRLAAADPAEAKAAYDRAVAADPQGTWADDALLESVLMDDPPATPEGFGAVTVAERDAWLARLRRIPGSGDRVREARRLAAVLKLLPLAGRDVREARRDLLGLTFGPVDDAEAAHARTWLGWIDAQEGRGDAAADAWVRVVADARDPDASRAACRLLTEHFLRAERPRDALDWNARSEALGGADDALARLAWRQWQRIDGRPQGHRGSEAEILAGGLRGDVAVARGMDGAWWFARLKDGIVERRRGDDPPAVWNLARLAAIAVDPYGRAFAANDRELVALVEGGHTRVAGLGDFGSPRALAVDRDGSVWAIDRRGSRLGRVVGDTVEAVHENRAARWIALQVGIDGPVAVDGKTGRLQRFDRDGTPAAGADAPGRPVSLALDAAGWTYTLDARGRRIEVRSHQGALRESIDAAALGLERPEALAVDRDGALVVYDAEDGVVKRFP